MPLTLRSLQTQDCPQLATLLAQDHWPPDPRPLPDRLDRLYAWPDQVAFAALEGDALLAVCQVQGVRLVASDGYAMVQLLTMAPGAEQAQLAVLAHAKAWAFAAGYGRFRVRIDAGNDAARTHLTAAGLGQHKAGYIFTRPLAANAATPPAPKPGVHIRPAHAGDAPAMAALMPDLGYESTPADMARRYAAICAWPENVVYLAEREGAVVGLCQVQGTRVLAGPDHAEVQALVVAEAQQGHGIGRALLAQAAAWGWAQGYRDVRLGSGAHRTEAHLFYEGQGYRKLPLSHALEQRAPAV
ncbi:GNAT family N-acetyltransferase [Chitinimonas sp.]|uniref:GNAT family N-acetyltransferase n=1 Tax=Chitinimonas sp. TaxID=1934313 RepID=UPI002F95B066